MQMQRVDQVWQMMIDVHDALQKYVESDDGICESGPQSDDILENGCVKSSKYRGIMAIWVHVKEGLYAHNCPTLT